MARTVKPAEYSAKRNEILDVAQRLVYTKGYERMTIQDILRELAMSSGAFYHYFDSKPAVLEAFIARLQQEAEEPLLSIVDDPHLSALEKLRHFFATLDRLRIVHKTTVLELLRVWYTDENAIVRQKVDTATAAWRAPLLTKIAQQGVQEGSFITDYPDQAGEIILAILQGMGNTHAQVLLALAQGRAESSCVDAIVATHAASMNAIERVVGAPTNSLERLDRAALNVWVAALRQL